MDKVYGLDVHKDSVFACILDEKGKKILEKRYGTLTSELNKLRDDLKSHGVSRITMESTSIYWMPVWQVLIRDFNPTCYPHTCMYFITTELRSIKFDYGGLRPFVSIYFLDKHHYTNKHRKCTAKKSDKNKC